MTNTLKKVAARTAVVCGFLILSGCLSDDPGSSSLAYVNIESHGMAAIREETFRVFSDENYRLVADDGASLTFEREGTQRDRLMYARYGESLAMRVVVSFEPLRKGGYVVRADAWVVRGGSEEPVLRMARRPYMQMLNRIKASLVSTAPEE